MSGGENAGSKYPEEYTKDAPKEKEPPFKSDVSEDMPQSNIVL